MPRADSFSSSSAFDSSDDEAETRRVASHRRRQSHQTPSLPPLAVADRDEDIDGDDGSAYDTSEEECGGEIGLEEGSGEGSSSDWGTPGVVRCCCIMAEDSIGGHLATARLLPSATPVVSKAAGDSRSMITHDLDDEERVADKAWLAIR